MQFGMEGLLACFFSFVQINQRVRIINGKKFKNYNIFFILYLLTITCWQCKDGNLLRNMVDKRALI